MPFTMDSADRIATTHVGSLPRSEMVSDVVLAIEQGAAVSEELFDAVISDAVDVAVASQKKIGTVHGEWPPSFL